MNFKEDQEVLKTGKSTDTYTEIDDNGYKHIYQVKKNPVCENGEIVGISGVINDVTELMELKRRFEELSYMDTFTQCYNRNYFLKHDYDEKKYLPCTYIMCDCNNLKKVNDRFGHRTGDKYIEDTVEILKSVLPEDGICIRWGGDEFLMIIPKCGEKKCDEIIQQINQQKNIKKETDPYVDIAMGAAVRKIKKAQMKFSQGDPDTGLSVGDVLRTDMSMSLKQAFEIADKKMYQDKNSYKKFHIVTKYRK